MGIGSELVQATAYAYSLLASSMKARIKITLKNGVLDPQGKAIQNALGSLGFTGIEDVRQASTSRSTSPRPTSGARAAVDRMCKELLANIVIENYTFELEKAP